MARVRIELEGPAVFTADIQVRVSDLNYGNHLGHDALVSLLHEARTRFFRSFGAHEADTEGCAMVVVDLAVRYRSEALLGQVLRVEIGVGEVGSRGCELLYRVTHSDSGEPMADAKTGIVFVDPRERSVAPIPPTFLAALGVAPG